ncbi:hypothetical protein B14911_28515 [Bacillus sp. NRRL B-14911]|nr:hypothetical protein B14911_28515 [Bacillus sp. NRRL B-14911]
MNFEFTLISSNILFNLNLSAAGFQHTYNLTGRHLDAYSSFY